MYYVYAHYKADDPNGLPFYIGKGKGKREYSNKRNRFWRNIVSKHGFISKKIADNLSEQAAWDLEILLISQFGKLCDHTGCLSNFSDGGEGAAGTKHTDQTKAKWSAAKKGKTWEEIYGLEQAQVIREKRKLTGRKPHSEETKKKLSEAKKGSNNPMFGKKLAPEHRRKLSESKLGNTNTKGKKYSDKARQNYKKAAKLREADPGKRLNASKKLTGIKRSEETRRRMSVAARLREAKKKLLTNEDINNGI
jgi:uncharacterized membrane protein